MSVSVLDQNFPATIARLEANKLPPSSLPECSWRETMKTQTIAKPIFATLSLLSWAATVGSALLLTPFTLTTIAAVLGLTALSTLLTVCTVAIFRLAPNPNDPAYRIQVREKIIQAFQDQGFSYSEVRHQFDCGTYEHPSSDRISWEQVISCDDIDLICRQDQNMSYEAFKTKHGREVFQYLSVETRRVLSDSFNTYARSCVSSGSSTIAALIQEASANHLELDPVLEKIHEYISEVISFGQLCMSANFVGIKNYNSEELRLNMIRRIMMLSFGDNDFSIYLMHRESLGITPEMILKSNMSLAQFNASTNYWKGILNDEEMESTKDQLLQKDAVLIVADNMSYQKFKERNGIEGIGRLEFTMPQAFRHLMTKFQQEVSMPDFPYSSIKEGKKTFKLSSLAIKSHLMKRWKNVNFKDRNHPLVVELCSNFQDAGFTASEFKNRALRDLADTPLDTIFSSHLVLLSSKIISIDDFKERLKGEINRFTDFEALVKYYGADFILLFYSGIFRSSTKVQQLSMEYALTNSEEFIKSRPHAPFRIIAEDLFPAQAKDLLADTRDEYRFIESRARARVHHMKSHVGIQIQTETNLLIVEFQDKMKKLIKELSLQEAS